MNAPQLVIEAARALERMAFVLAEPLETEPARVLATATWRASVPLTGNGLGFVLVAADDEFVREVAGGMLGCEPEDVDLAAHGEATALELANVLGGHAINEGDGDDSPLRLGLPVRIEREVANGLLSQATAGGFCGVIATATGRLLIAGVMRQSGA